MEKWWKVPHQNEASDIASDRWDQGDAAQLTYSSQAYLMLRPRRKESHYVPPPSRTVNSCDAQAPEKLFTGGALWFPPEWCQHRATVCLCFCSMRTLHKYFRAWCRGQEQKGARGMCVGPMTVKEDKMVRERVAVSPGTCLDRGWPEAAWGPYT